MNTTYRETGKPLAWVVANSKTNPFCRGAENPQQKVVTGNKINQHDLFHVTNRRQDRAKQRNSGRDELPMETSIDQSVM
jgi:hypothetical protein